MLTLLIPSIIFTATSAALTIIVPIFGRRKIHLIWTLFNFFVALWGVCLIAVSLAGPDIKSADLYWRFGNIGGLFIAAFFVHFVHVFCEIKNGLMIFISYAHAAIFTILTISGTLQYNLKFIYNSFYYPSATQPLYATEALLWISLILYGHYVLISSQSRFTIDKNIQIRFLLLAFIIGFVSGGSSHWLRVFGLNIHPGWCGFVTLYSLLVTYAIFRHRLLGLDLAIRKGLAYTFLLSAFTFFYFAAIFIIEKIFQQSYGYKQVYSFMVSAIVILLVEPLRRRVQHFIDFTFFKGDVLSLHRDKERLTMEIIKQDKMKSISTLAAGMAHEIKNPLTSIKTFAEYLPVKYDDPKFRQNFSRIVVDEVDRINNIVGQLLEFSKPSDLKLISCNVNTVLEETLGLMSNNLLKSKIGLAKDLDRSLPDILADRNQLKQAFLNLLLNSIQSMSHGGRLLVTTNLTPDHRIQVVIADTGCGVKREHLPHIFDPFYTTKEQGSGLGLAIVDSIIKKHGGKIEVQSKEGEGTTINVFLKSRD